MAKMFNYMAITVGIWIFLTIMGVSVTGTFVTSKLGMGSPSDLVNIQDSIAWSRVLAAIAGLATGTVLISFFTKTISAIPATALLVTYVFLAMVMDMVGLINLVSEVWLKNVLWFFLTIYAAGFLITAYDWIRGID